MFNRIVAGIISYGDWEGLGRTLLSVQGLCMEVYVIHCKFIGFPVEIPESFERTRKLVHRLHNRGLMPPMIFDRFPTINHFYNYEYKREWQLRQEVLHICEMRRPDFLLIIDSDEYLTGNFEEFDRNITKAKKEFPDDNVFGINCTYQGGWQHFPRLWRNPHNMMYKFSHYRFINKGELNHYYDDYEDPIRKVVDGVKIIHDHDLRTEEQNKASREYGKWLKAEEEHVSANTLNKPMGHAYPSGMDESYLQHFRERFSNHPDKSYQRQ